MRRWMILLMVVAMFARPQSAAAVRSRFFRETHQYISGRFLEFWEQNGGLATFGLPITPAVLTTPTAAQPRVRLIQSFERARFVLHTEAKAPDDVQQAPVGEESLAARRVDPRKLPRTTFAGPGCQFAAETAHQICGALLQRWLAYPAVFGQPLTDLVEERGADGEPEIVQYFSRARFVLHPTQTAPDDVVLTALERDRLAGPPSNAQPLPLPYYFFPVQPQQRAIYGREHHDYPATDIFTPIGSHFVAPTAGVVEYVNHEDRWDPKTDLGEDRGGLSVSIVGDDGIRYYGSHLSAITAGIRVGVRVAAGQLLGLTGKTGSARPTDPHLHFGISRPTTADDWAARRGQINPYPFIKRWQAGYPVRPDVAWLQ